MNATIVKGAASVGAVAVLVFGAAAISGADDSSSRASAPRGVPGGGSGGFPGPAPGAVPGGRGPDRRGFDPDGDGRGPRRGFRQPVTGATATKVAAAASARYPGTVEQVQQLPDGSYVAHVITAKSGELHVIVTSDFQVRGAFGRRDGGRRFPPPQGAQPPQGQVPAAPSTSSGGDVKS